MRWWYEQNGQAKGPVEDGELRSLIEQGTLNRNSRVIQEGGSEWTTVAQEASLIASSPDAGGGAGRGTPGSGYVPRYTSAPTGEPPDTAGPGQPAQGGYQPQGAFSSPTPGGTAVATDGTDGGSSIFSGKFWIDLGERVVRSFIQTFLGALIAGGALNVSIPTLKAGAIAAIAAVLAVIMGVMSGPFGRKGSASVVV